MEKLLAPPVCELGLSAGCEGEPIALLNGGEEVKTSACHFKTKMTSLYTQFSLAGGEAPPVVAINHISGKGLDGTGMGVCTG